MENPEEVLQALDEFQKMRPSEIPRELEDYLCWVARTGDPVYQWSLVKALFREKLTRVMTEFYESCPTLDLTPCPNVEQFNYDVMKSTLLERLESFANAPFTVQRICELLTTPRKEYNRIDKFMRAIEKNILVVSTREPGPYGRRSENGDSLVNGSVEDETSHHGQASNEIEMENWVKDCTVTTAVPVHTGDSEDMSIENGLNSPLKTPFGKQERMEHQLSTVDTTASSFVTSATDFQETGAMPTQVSVQEVAVVQNLTAINHESAAIVGDVSDAIMNEDTSSQPSLELESDDNSISDSKKLQTTFQAKDFTLDEVKSPKTYSEALKGCKTEESIESTEINKECDQLIQSTYSNEKLLNETTSDLQSSDKTDNLEVNSTVGATDQLDIKLDNEPQASIKSESESNLSENNFPHINNNLDISKDDSEDQIVASSELLAETKCETDVKDENKIEPVINEEVTKPTESSENCITESSEPLKTETLLDIGKPIIEEPLIETTDSSTVVKDESTELTIEETTEDSTKVSKTIVPDPIPIVQESKDIESVTKDWDNAVSVIDEISEPKDVSSVKNGLDKSPEKLDPVEDNQMVISGCEEAPSNKGAAAELMDVDNEALLANAQQDEPMEEEMTETMSS